MLDDKEYEERCLFLRSEGLTRSSPEELTSLGLFCQERDEEEMAEEMYMTASVLGYAPAMYHLALLMSDRSDPDLDVQIREWINRSCQGGYSKACELVQQLDDSK